MRQSLARKNASSLPRKKRGEVITIPSWEERGRDIDRELEEKYTLVMANFGIGQGQTGYIGVAPVPRFTVAGFVAWCQEQKLSPEQTLRLLRGRYCTHSTLIRKKGPCDMSWPDIPLKRLTLEQMRDLAQGKDIALRTSFLSWRRISGNYWCYRSGNCLAKRPWFSWE